jgi:hypothetical protein
MALTYGVILSAPVLRLEWIVIGRLIPSTMEQINCPLPGSTLNEAAGSACRRQPRLW